MQQNRHLDWLLDDWQKAVRRSLIRAFTKQQTNALRWQWRIGQASKWALLLLPMLLLFSLTVPEADILLLEILFVWSAMQAHLLAVHVVLGVRHGVSYSWAVHHSRPFLLHGAAARFDIRLKALMAAVAALVAVSCLV